MACQVGRQLPRLKREWWDPGVPSVGDSSAGPDLYRRFEVRVEVRVAVNMVSGVPHLGDRCTVRVGPTMDTSHNCPGPWTLLIKEKSLLAMDT